MLGASPGGEPWCNVRAKELKDANMRFNPHPGVSPGATDSRSVVGGEATFQSSPGGVLADQTIEDVKVGRGSNAFDPSQPFNLVGLATI